MTHGDIARVLTAASARDNRTIGDADILAWHQDIGDLDFDVAVEAVSRHYRESTDRLMPAHVRRLAATIVDERRRAVLRERAAVAELEAGPEPPRGPLSDRRAEIREFVAHVREILPEGDPEALRPRAAYWEREHAAYRRQTDAEPNPLYAGPPPSGGHPVPELTEEP